MASAFSFEKSSRPRPSTVAVTPIHRDAPHAARSVVSPPAPPTGPSVPPMGLLKQLVRAVNLASAGVGAPWRMTPISAQGWLTRAWTAHGRAPRPSSSSRPIGDPVPPIERLRRIARVLRGFLAEAISEARKDEVDMSPLLSPQEHVFVTLPEDRDGGRSRIALEDPREGTCLLLVIDQAGTCDLLLIVRDPEAREGVWRLDTITGQPLWEGPDASHLVGARGRCTCVLLGKLRLDRLVDALTARADGPVSRIAPHPPREAVLTVLYPPPPAGMRSSTSIVASASRSAESALRARSRRLGGAPWMSSAYRLVGASRLVGAASLFVNDVPLDHARIAERAASVRTGDHEDGLSAFGDLLSIHPPGDPEGHGLALVLHEGRDSWIAAASSGDTCTYGAAVRRIQPTLVPSSPSPSSSSSAAATPSPGTVTPTHTAQGRPNTPPLPQTPYVTLDLSVAVPPSHPSVPAGRQDGAVVHLTIDGTLRVSARRTTVREMGMRLFPSFKSTRWQITSGTDGTSSSPTIPPLWPEAIRAFDETLMRRLLVEEWRALTEEEMVNGSADLLSSFATALLHILRTTNHRLSEDIAARALKDALVGAVLLVVCSSEPAMARLRGHRSGYRDRMERRQGSLHDDPDPVFACRIPGEGYPSVHLTRSDAVSLMDGIHFLVAREPSLPSDPGARAAALAFLSGAREQPGGAFMRPSRDNATNASVAYRKNCFSLSRDFFDRFVALGPVHLVDPSDLLAWVHLALYQFGRCQGMHLLSSPSPGTTLPITGPPETIRMGSVDYASGTRRVYRGPDSHRPTPALASVLVFVFGTAGPRVTTHDEGPRPPVPIDAPVDTPFPPVVPVGAPPERKRRTPEGGKTDTSAQPKVLVTEDPESPRPALTEEEASGVVDEFLWERPEAGRGSLDPPPPIVPQPSDQPAGCIVPYTDVQSLRRAVDDFLGQGSPGSADIGERTLQAVNRAIILRDAVTDAVPELRALSEPREISQSLVTLASRSKILEEVGRFLNSKYPGTVSTGEDVGRWLVTAIQRYDEEFAKLQQARTADEQQLVLLAQDQARQLAMTNDNLQAAIGDNRARLQVYQAELARVEAHGREVTQIVRSEEARFRSLVDEIQRRSEEIKDVNRRHRRALTGLEKATEENRQALIVRDRTQNAIDLLTSQISTKTAELDSLTSTIAVRQATLSGLEARIISKASESTRIEGLLASARLEVGSLRDEISVLKREIHDLKTKRDEAQAALDEKIRESVTPQLREARKLFEEQSRALKQEINGLNEQRRALENTLTQLNREKRSAESYIRGLTRGAAPLPGRSSAASAGASGLAKTLASVRLTGGASPARISYWAKRDAAAAEANALMELGAPMDRSPPKKGDPPSETLDRSAPLKLAYRLLAAYWNEVAQAYDELPEPPSPPPSGPPAVGGSEGTSASPVGPPPPTEDVLRLQRKENALTALRNSIVPLAITPQAGAPIDLTTNSRLISLVHKSPLKVDQWLYLTRHYFRDTFVWDYDLGLLWGSGTETLVADRPRVVTQLGGPRKLLTWVMYFDTRMAIVRSNNPQVASASSLRDLLKDFDAGADLGSTPDYNFAQHMAYFRQAASELNRIDVASRVTSLTPESVMDLLGLAGGADALQRASDVLVQAETIDYMRRMVVEAAKHPRRTDDPDPPTLPERDARVLRTAVATRIVELTAADVKKREDAEREEKGRALMLRFAKLQSYIGTSLADIPAQAPPRHPKDRSALIQVTARLRAMEERGNTRDAGGGGHV